MGTNPVREQAKLRKPYTITKQREKWTDEEHNRFLEALRLHGRTWQRIQEHIGTKSAVQIRSHAQKFFLKMEKGNEGKSPGHSQDLEIPPPRPKRKPHSSYPRMTSAASRNPSEGVGEENLSKSFVLLCSDKVKLDTKTKTLGEGPQSTSVYFHNDVISERSQERIPTKEEFKEKRIRLTKELKKNDAELKIFGASGNFTEPHFRFASSSKDNLEDGQSREKVSDQIEGTEYSGEGISTSFLAQLQSNADLNLSLDSTRPARQRPNKNSVPMSSIHHTIPSISLINQVQNDKNAFNALINITNCFPSLLASALSQNPALHEAASIAAALLPPTYMDFCMTGEDQQQQASSPSGMSAIVTATVAAASAWWRVHGLLPSPFLTNHALLRMMEVSQFHQDDNINSKEHVNQNDKQKSAAEMQPCSALLEPSSSPDTCVNQASEKKKHDPSSSDSNTSPSCEVEKVADLNVEQTQLIHGQGRQPPYITQEFRDPRNSKSCNDNGLEQGPLAFQALFSREVLSQLPLDANLAFNSGKVEDFGLQIDLNRKLFAAATCNRSKEIAMNGPAAENYKKHLVEEAERRNADQEESSTKKACL